MARAARVVRLIGAGDGDGRFVSVGKERWPSNTCTGVLARLVDLLSGRKMMDGVSLSSRHLFVALLISSPLPPGGGGGFDRNCLLRRIKDHPGISF